MPAESKAQYALMKAKVAGAKIPGLSSKTAEEFIKATPNPKLLPNRISKKGKK